MEKVGKMKHSDKALRQMSKVRHSIVLDSQEIRTIKTSCYTGIRNSRGPTTDATCGPVLDHSLKIILNSYKTYFGDNYGYWNMMGHR